MEVEYISIREVQNSWFRRLLKILLKPFGIKIKDNLGPNLIDTSQDWSIEWFMKYDDWRNEDGPSKS